MSEKEYELKKLSPLSESEQIEAVKTIKRLFVTRSDTYAEQKLDKDGKQQYIRIKEPLTEEVIKRHLKGEITVGSYVLEPKSGLLRWCCLDIDADDISNSKEKTKQLFQRLRNSGLDNTQILLEKSGSADSYHIWIFFDKPTSPTEAIAFLKHIIKPIDKEIETYPKRDNIKKDGFGVLVKIPFAYHQEQKRWSNCYLQKEDSIGVTGFEALQLVKTCELPKLQELKTEGLRPCFKQAIEERWILKGGAFRLALAAEMIGNDYSDKDIHAVFSLQPNYNFATTQEKIEFSRVSNYHHWQCETIKERCGNLVGEMCPNCSRIASKIEKEEKEEPVKKSCKTEGQQTQKNPNKAVKKKGEKAKELTLGDVLALPNYENSGEIENIIVLKKSCDGQEQDFFISAKLVDGKIVHELTHSRAIPPQTAPSFNFHEQGYKSLSAVYQELYDTITDYAAFGEDSIYPKLIALGSMASYFREVYYTFPFFDFTSSEPEAGKTTAMKVQTFTAFYGTLSSSVTEALLFREISDSHCFYGLDNVERFFTSPKDYIALIDWLLSSHSRDIPCKRLEKTEDGYRVCYFDGHGIKAFTHIRDFPYALRALRSRCIQVVMQKKKPKLSYPSADKFSELRDRLYTARLYEFEDVEKRYQKCIDSKVLTGRTGDLYFPLLAIAKLINLNLYEAVLKYARSDEGDRIELDSWNKTLIQVLLSENMIGSTSTTAIKSVLEDALRAEGLLKADKALFARTVTSRLKKLGFEREDKKTDNKTWFIIEAEKLVAKAYEYDLVDEDELEKYANEHTPPKHNLVNLVNFSEDRIKDKEGSTEHRGEGKRGTGEIGNGISEVGDELTELGKLAKRGVCASTKNVCDGCGMNAQTTEYNGEWLCDKCLTDYADNLKGTVGIRPDAFDEDFQIKQDKEAADRLEVASDE